jgi:hypothetical protein
MATLLQVGLEETVIQFDRAMGFCLLQVAPSKECKTYLEYLQYCGNLHGKACIKELATRSVGTVLQTYA